MVIYIRNSSVRLEEKLSDIEVEGQVLRQQTLATVPPPTTDQVNIPRYY